MSELTKINERLDELQIKLAFQEDTIDQLNAVVTEQSLEIQKLWDANRLLKASLDEQKNISGDGMDAANVPPPHY